MDAGPLFIEQVRIEIPGAPRGVERTGTRSWIDKSNPDKPVARSVNYTKADTRTEQGVIRMMADQAMNGNPPFEGPLILRFSMFLPIPASKSGKWKAMALQGMIRPTVKPDWDNVAKFVDPMKHIVFRDDNQFVEAHEWKFYSDRPRSIVVISRWHYKPPE